MKQTPFGLSRRNFSFALIAAGLAAPAARAQAKYPDRPVRVILPFGAGGVADVTARLVAQALSEKLGQNFVIENMPGAGGIAAARAALAGGTDGYTLTLLTNGTAISVPLFTHLPFDPLKEFAPISTIGYFTCDFMVNAASPYQTLGDFLKAAKEKPGTLNVGTINVGGTQNLTAELFKAMAGIDVVIVPFRGSPDVVVALLRNDVQLAIDFYAALKPTLDGGKARVIATSAPKRSPELPNIPTVQEGGVANFDVTAWNGLYAPAGTARRHHPDLEQGAARGAGRPRPEEARARSRHRRQGVDAGGARRAHARRYREMGQGDRAGRHCQAVTLVRA